MTIVGYPLAWWLIDLAVAVTIGLIAAVTHWAITQPHRWAEQREAYELRLAERQLRRPFDEAWAAWVAGDYGVRVLVDVTVAGFERRVDELWARCEQSRALVDAEVLH